MAYRILCTKAMSDGCGLGFQMLRIGFTQTEKKNLVVKWRGANQTRLKNFQFLVRKSYSLFPY